MNDNNLFLEAFDAIDDEFLAEAKHPSIRAAARRKKLVISSLAVCVAAVLVIIPSIKPINNSKNNNFTTSYEIETVYEEEIIKRPSSTSENQPSKEEPTPSNPQQQESSAKTSTTSKVSKPKPSSKGESTTKKPTYLNDIVIKTNDLYFTNIDTNGPTTTYEKVYSPNADYLYINPIPTGKYVTIYKGYYEKDINQNEATSLADEYFPKISKVLNTVTPGYDIYTYSSSISINDKFENNDFYGVSIGVTTMPNRNIVHFSNFENPVSINGQIFTISTSQTDDDIINSLGTLKQQMFDLFGVSFNDAKVIRHYDEKNLYAEYTVYLYNSNEHILNDSLGSSPYTDYISISFDDYDNKSPNTYYLSDVWYWSFRTKDKSHSKAIAKKELLPLEKAEEYLSKGYVLAMGGCALCQAEQTPVDFTDYDYVSFEYKGGFNVGVLAIPYYAFYKNIGTSESGNVLFAKTYVPAVEVEGYEEYFINNHNNHTNSKNDNINMNDIISYPKPPT